jgi:acetoin:2,6-dichlorophenolindophenol oxidoreductase subunit beta
MSATATRIETLNFRDAIKRALIEELERDPRVLLFGEDVARAGGVFKVTEGIAERVGSDRVLDTPISELAIAGAGFGAAVTGSRPVIEIMFGDFMALAMDSLINQAAKWRYVSNDQTTVPLVVRSTVGAGARFGPIHCQIPATWMQGVPGLKLVCPSNPNDAHGLLVSAIRDDDPVVFFEHKRLYGNEGEVTGEPLEIGKAHVAREGTDVTIVSVLKGVVDALEAADTLQREDGISAEVVDLRSLRPLDVATVIASLENTNRLVCVEEGPRTGGWAAGLAGEIAVDALDVLDDVWTITTPDHPIPFSAPLEDAALPSAASIRSAVRDRLGAG